MGTKIKVTPSEMTRAAGDIEKLTANYKTTYENLCRQLKDLSVNWTGEDNTNFTTKIEDFKPYFKKMEDLMTEYVQFLRRSAQTYTEAQEDISKKAASLADSIN